MKTTKAELTEQLAHANQELDSWKAHCECLNADISKLELRLAEAVAKLAAIPPPVAPPPEPAFKVGDPVLQGSDHRHCDFIDSRMWSAELNTWRYGINFSQANMCSLTRWQGGGSCFWVSECELKHPEGLVKLEGELWRRLRLVAELENELKYANEEAGKLRFAMGQVTSQEPPG